ncbi:MAG: hypothetical protein ABEJ72_05825 [Candidatus Aenigmatarchaeota archaeon]
MEIDEDESEFKICRVDDKKVLGEDRVQLNLNDGKNIEVTEDFEIETGSSVVITLPDKEVEEVIGLEEGNDVMITEGKNRGKLAEFKKKKTVKGSASNRVIVKGEDREINLPEDLVFPVDGGKIDMGGS